MNEEKIKQELSYISMSNDHIRTFLKEKHVGAIWLNEHVQTIDESVRAISKELNYDN